MVEGRRSRLWLLALAWFNVLVGVIGGGTGAFLTALSGLSVHDEDSIPPCRLAVACGLLGLVGLLVLPWRPRLAAVWAAVSVAVSTSGVAASFWRREALMPSGGGMLMLAGLNAAVGVVGLIEIVFLCRVGAPTDYGRREDYA